MVLPTEFLPRGVWPVPALSHLGEMILCAVASDHRILKNGRRFVAPGENPWPAHDELVEKLDREDPIPAEQGQDRVG